MRMCRTAVLTESLLIATARHARTGVSRARLGNRLVLPVPLPASRPRSRSAPCSWPFGMPFPESLAPPRLPRCYKSYSGTVNGQRFFRGGGRFSVSYAFIFTLYPVLFFHFSLYGVGARGLYVLRVPRIRYSWLDFACCRQATATDPELSCAAVRKMAAVQNASSEACTSAHALLTHYHHPPQRTTTSTTHRYSHCGPTTEHAPVARAGGTPISAPSPQRALSARDAESRGCVRG